MRMTMSRSGKESATAERACRLFRESTTVSSFVVCVLLVLLMIANAYSLEVIRDCGRMERGLRLLQIDQLLGVRTLQR
jgi:hypothetical protein